MTNNDSPHETVPVEGDPFGEPHHLVPVDHDPFNPVADLTQFMMSINREQAAVYSELAQLRQMAEQMRQILQGLLMAQHAPKRIIRDERGWPQGLVVDHELTNAR